MFCCNVRVNTFGCAYSCVRGFGCANGFCGLTYTACNSNLATAERKWRRGRGGKIGRRAKADRHAPGSMAKRME